MAETVQLDKFDLHKKLMALGVSDLDAKILLDCIVAKKSCSWVNIDEVSESVVTALNKFMVDNNHPLTVKIDPVPTRSKYIWEVKAIIKR
ncbi:hypothetical protein J4450_08480 [Candidatus Micrarchaeota archaeon]|nr:hypothetical protein [Candidatus Micrarchaeota archaeon]